MATTREKFDDAYEGTLRLVEAEVAVGASFPRILSKIHAQFSAGLFRSDKAAHMNPLKRSGYLTVQQPHMGRMLQVRADFCAELHSAFLQHVLAAHLRPGIDMVFEIGCGIGHDLVRLAAYDPAIPFVGGEIARSGREVVAALAAAARVDNVTAIDFDISAPDFEFLRGKNALIYSNFALVYANPFPRDFFPRLLDTVAGAHILLFEPVSFEFGAQAPEPPLFTRDRARAYGICEDLWAVIQDLSQAGRIAISEVVPDISGRSLNGTVSLLRFTKVV